MTEEPVKRSAMLDLALSKKQGLVRNVNLKGSLGFSDHEMVVFQGIKEDNRKLTI